MKVDWNIVQFILVCGTSFTTGERKIFAFTENTIGEMWTKYPAWSWDLDNIEEIIKV